MERNSHLSQTAVVSNSCSRIGTPGRGRGRGWYKRCHQTENATTPGSANEISASSGKALSSSPPQGAEINHNQFDNPDMSRSSSDSPNSTPLKEKSASDKENSCSPRPQRSRRAVFDTGVMFQINNHLRKGINERSDTIATRSLDRMNKVMSPSTGPRNMRLSRPSSPNLHTEIPHDNTSQTQNGAALCKKLIAEGRPRSMTDPATPSAGEDSKVRQVDGTEAKSSGLIHQSPAVHPLPSVSSLVSATKHKGRGRGRGYARNKHLEMEATSHPGVAAEGSSGHDLSEPHKNTATNKEQFIDAIGSHANSRGHVCQSVPSNITVSSGLPIDSVTKAPSGNENGLDCGSTSLSANQSSSKPPPHDESASRTVSANESGSQAEHTTASRHGKGLTLKIAPDEPNPVTEPSVSSPDNIAFLLSPNHEFVIDWAAAMETPTPDTSSDSAPDWSASNFSF